MDTQATIQEYNEKALVLPSQYDKAIIGMASRINFGPVVAYDVQKLIEILSNEMEVDEDDIEEFGSEEAAKHFRAREHYEFNIIGGYHGEDMPIFVETEDFEQEEDEE